MLADDHTPGGRPVTRRRFLGGVALTALSAAACSDDIAGSAPVTSSTAPRVGSTLETVANTPPNVLYVAVDDLGTQLGAYGHANVMSPRIDAFAAANTLFEQCFVQAPICGASRTSILLGLRPETTGVLRNQDQWRTLYPDPVASLPRHFRDNGYRTLGAGKINDERNGPLDDAWDLPPESPEIRPGQLEALIDEAARSDAPFFAAVGFNQTHCPWEPSEAAAASYTAADIDVDTGPVREVRAAYLARCVPEFRAGVETEPETFVEMTDAEAREIAGSYLASVTDVDAAFGRLLDAAENRDLLDNTIVVFWSGDHGYSLGHHLWGKWDPFDEAARIPLVMKLPPSVVGDGATPSRIEGMVEALDMYPTLLALCGLPRPSQPLEGESFADALVGSGEAGKAAVFSRFGRYRSVRTEEWFYLRDDAWGVGSLFDRIRDPAELEDVAEVHPEIVDQLATLLDETSPAVVA